MGRQTGRSTPWKRLALHGVLSLGAVLLIVAKQRVETKVNSPFPVASASMYHPLFSLLDKVAEPVAEGQEIPLEIPFRPGETVGDVLAVLPFAPAEIPSLVNELSAHADLRKIRPQDRYAALYQEEELAGFQLTLDGQGRAKVLKAADGWKGSWEAFDKRIEIRRVSGELVSSLEGGITAAGGESTLSYLMADVLQWDMDFTRDLRVGDRFDVLYEAIYLDGTLHSLGEIVALSYVNAGRQMEAYRYGPDESPNGTPSGKKGYYDAEGRPLRKMFLRSPMRYSRITSRFSKRRFHPVLKKHRPHYGVDYGAPTGTPVRVTSNGVVTSAGWNGGAGNTVKVRHPNGYLTAYLHLSKFAKGIRSGKRVSQGDVIGYVGSTGLSTGPHLDYRVQQSGKWIDPLSLKSVPADPVGRKDMPEFLAHRDALRRDLWLGSPPRSDEGSFSVAQGNRAADDSSSGQ